VLEERELHLERVLVPMGRGSSSSSSSAASSASATGLVDRDLAEGVAKAPRA
jgi:hypothetical protein